MSTILTNYLHDRYLIVLKDLLNNCFISNKLHSTTDIVGQSG